MRIARCVRVSVRGFTLLELSISLAIMGIMMGVLLSNYPETAVRLALINTSHTISLLVREGQVRGSAVDSGNASLTEESPIGGYGVYAEIITPNTIILFSDMVDASVAKPFGLAVGDGLYQTTPINETSRITTLPSKYKIAKLCVGTGFPFTCNTANVPSISTLTISFTRPNPQPDVYINGVKTTNFSAACIELHSPRAPSVGHIRSVQVFNSGMIRTQNGRCDNSS